MAEKISSRLEGQLDVVVPTTIVMVALTSTLLGLVFFTMRWFRVTSIANYMPYPVIAGFLSGIGAELMKNGVHMASSRALSWAFFSVDTQRLLVPAILFAAVARLAQYWKIPVAISFPCLLLVSLLGFQGAAYLWDASMDELGHAEWVFAWDPAVVARTPMWYPWATIEWTHRFPIVSLLPHTSELTIWSYLIQWYHILLDALNYKFDCWAEICHTRVTVYARYVS
ncbi:hypothetical protein PsorP6_016616 [Peronosclerospora sorghi]|uniref:Uncharacterized protein n=1 Tax=Peronosclerospora sorghi TaxID=230839 RepID=A0ACC0VQU3_9STRA|nr:hypothetical protein PsorP6_016616 [Peronosclerospora sorghi]